MYLSPSERQSLIGPAVVGCLLGVFMAYAVFAFASEYKLQGIGVGKVKIMLEALLGFIVALLATIGVFGLLPVALHRILLKWDDKS